MHMNVDNFYWVSIFIAVNGLLLLALAINVSVIRFSAKISFGDGGNKKLFKAIRAHANGMEHVPIFTLLLLALTLNSLSPTFLALLTIGFTLSRVAHAVGILFGIHLVRVAGAGITYLLQGIAAVELLFNILR